MHQSAVDEVLNQPLSRELLARDLTRLAFIALDGTPRSIPIGFFWNGAEIVMCTSTNARKLPALRRNPAVALTIHTETHPPRSCSSVVGPNWMSSTASRTSTCSGTAPTT